MSRFAHPLWKRCVLVVCGVVLAAPLVYAQSQTSNVHSDTERKLLHSQNTTSNQLYLTCYMDRPGQVQRFRVTCSGTSKVDVKTADCCIPGDHWQVKVKQYDSRPNTAVTTSPGGDGNYGVAARVYTYNSSHQVDALIECSYLHGANVFPAETDIIVEHGGSCTVTDLGFTDEVDRSP